MLDTVEPVWLGLSRTCTVVRHQQGCSCMMDWWCLWLPLAGTGGDKINRGRQSTRHIWCMSTVCANKIYPWRVLTFIF